MNLSQLRDMDGNIIQEHRAIEMGPNNEKVQGFRYRANISYEAVAILL